MFVTLLNTTPPGPTRYADPANRPPALAGTLPNRTSGAGRQPIPGG